MESGKSSYIMFLLNSEGLEGHRINFKGILQELIEKDYYDYIKDFQKLAREIEHKKVNSSITATEEVRLTTLKYILLFPIGGDFHFRAHKREFLKAALKQGTPECIELVLRKWASVEPTSTDVQGIIHKYGFPGT